jgi:hypothetical protein
VRVSVPVIFVIVVRVLAAVARGVPVRSGVRVGVAARAVTVQASFE